MNNISISSRIEKMKEKYDRYKWKYFICHEAGKINNIYSLFIAKDNKIYISGNNSDEVLIYSKDGKYLNCINNLKYNDKYNVGIFNLVYDFIKNQFIFIDIWNYKIHCYDINSQNIKYTFDNPIHIPSKSPFNQKSKKYTYNHFYRAITNCKDKIAVVSVETIDENKSILKVFTIIDGVYADDLFSLNIDTEDGKKNSYLYYDENNEKLYLLYGDRYVYSYDLIKNEFVKKFDTKKHSLFLSSILVKDQYILGTAVHSFNGLVKFSLDGELIYKYNLNGMYIPLNLSKDNNYIYFASRGNNRIYYTLLNDV